MRNTLRLTILFLLLFVYYSGLPAQTADAPKELINFGEMDIIQSKILDEKRKDMVYVPRGNEGETYPVVYLLDGGGHYYSVIMLSSQKNYGTAAQTIMYGAVHYVVKDQDAFQEINEFLQEANI